MNPNLKRLPNGLFVLVNDTHLSRWVEQDGRLDHAHEYLAQFKKFIPLNGVVIDCGTSIGDHTVTYAQYVGPNGRVLGFEANADSHECACLNLAIYRNTTIYNVGVSDDYGVAGMALSPNVGASHLDTKNGREVHLAPLDDYTDGLARLDFIKVDIEGFETRMLKGCKNTFKKFSPAILMEINEGALNRQGTTSEEVFSLLRGYGYRYNPVDGKLGDAQFDILARK